MASSSLVTINGGVQTFDSTPTTIVTVPIDMSVVRMEISTLATRPSNNNVKTWEQLILVERHNGGASITGSLLDVLTPIGTAITTTLWSVGATVSGNNVLIQVTGQAAAIINWYCSAVCMCVMGD